MSSIPIDSNSLARLLVDLLQGYLDPHIGYDCAPKRKDFL